MYVFAWTLVIVYRCLYTEFIGHAENICIFVSLRDHIGKSGFIYSGITNRN